MPFGAESTISIDHRTQNLNNQTTPLLLSNKGRYIWGEGPMVCSIADGNISISSRGEITVGRAEEGTLRGAYMEACRLFFPPSGITPSSEFFVQPQYNTWIELTYNQNQQDIMTYAKGIVENGYPTGVLMIDDNWQKYYGNFEFRPDRFPSPAEMMERLHEMGFKTVMTEGAKHILSWKSPNYVYNSSAAPKLKVLLRNTNLSDELAFHFSDPAWHNFPMNAEAYAIGMANLPEEEQVANIWVGAETFGMRQSAETGIFDFLKALPYFAMEQGMGFMTPSEVAKKFAANDAIVAAHPLTWAGEAKDLSTYNGNDLQQEALNKLYAVAERVHLCQDKQLKRDWLILQDINYLHFMNHIDQGATQFESAYDAFINYMNILSDFLQRVEEQYPTTIENEELNELLKTIQNQEKEIERLEKQLKEAKKAKKACNKKAEK